MTTGYHPLVKRLLDGELSLAELPPELRAEGEEALRLVGAADRAPVALSPALEERVMAAVRHAASSHTASLGNRAWRWLNTPRDVELRLRVRPWTVWAGAFAAAAALALLLGRPAPQAARAIPSSCGSCCTHPARAASQWRARSISGTAPPRLSCRPGGAAYGRLASRSPSGSISTRSWWMVHAGWRIRAPQPWTTALVAATASSP